jgi:hypothetical protein
MISASFGTALVDIIAVVWHRSNLLDLLIISGALAVALIILLISALVDTLDIHPELDGIFISNCGVRSPAFL